MNDHTFYQKKKNVWLIKQAAISILKLNGEQQWLAYFTGAFRTLPTG